jgi:hypothetical protein
MSTNAAIELTPEEREERAALRRRFDRQFGQSRAEIVPIDRAKKPLGLGIVLDDDERAAARDEDDPTNGWKGFHFRDKHDAAFLESAVSFAWLFHFLDIVGGALLGVHNDGVREVNDLWDDVQRKIKESSAAQRAEQRLEVAELKTVIAELKAEVSALRSVQEGQRIQSRGEAGVAGPRGVAGSQGPVGPAGPQGPRGDAAAMIVGWEPRVERFELVPILGDGTRGVSAGLMPFFQQYHAQVEANEANDEE